MNGDWWWHVFHDPMNENPWSMLALLAILGAGACIYWAVAARKP